MISSIITLPTHRITTGVNALMSRLKALMTKSFGLLRYISRKKRGMVLRALKESFTLVLSLLSVIDLKTGLANCVEIFEV